MTAEDAQARALGRGASGARLSLARAAFLALNALLGFINALTGGSWWAFWPLIVTGFVLAIHYFLYKTVAADERWVEERTEELNLKSYDRGHIEDLKNALQRRDRSQGRSAVTAHGLWPSLHVIQRPPVTS